MPKVTTNVTAQAYANELVGWVAEGNDRGTWRVITTSLLTIAICTYTVLHPRIHVGRKLKRMHKLCQFVKQVFAPELESIEALQEFLQARRTLACCAEKTDNKMTLVQAYYVGMMGIRYKCGTKGGHRVLWPLQFAYLINTGLVAWPPDHSYALDEEIIKDKSKADGLVKFTALWQVMWFTVNCITRSVHGYALAPLESMTLAYVVQVVLTYMLWWKKPKDVDTASFVTLPEMTEEQRQIFDSLSMEATYDVPDPKKHVQSLGIAWYIIPRDCSDSAYETARTGSNMATDHAPKRSKGATHEPPTQVTIESKAGKEELGPEKPKLIRATALALMEVGGRPGVKTGGSVPSDDRVVTEWDSSLYMTKWWPAVCALGCSFGAVHFVSWDATFPTRVEHWLWKSCAVGSIVTALVTMQFKRISFRWQGFITFVQFGTPVLYVLCRLAMVAETIAAFRGLPRSTYADYAVVNYWVHFF